MYIHIIALYALRCLVQGYNCNYNNNPEEVPGVRAYDYSNFEGGVYTGMKWQVGAAAPAAAAAAAAAAAITRRVVHSSPAPPSPCASVSSSLVVTGCAHATYAFPATFITAPSHPILKRLQNLKFNPPNPFYSFIDPPQGHPAARRMGCAYVPPHKRLLEDERRLCYALHS